MNILDARTKRRKHVQAADPVPNSLTEISFGDVSDTVVSPLESTNVNQWAVDVNALHSAAAKMLSVMFQA